MSFLEKTKAVNNNYSNCIDLLNLFLYFCKRSFYKIGNNEINQLIEYDRDNETIIYSLEATL